MSFIRRRLRYDTLLSPTRPSDDFLNLDFADFCLVLHGPYGYALTNRLVFRHS